MRKNILRTVVALCLLGTVASFAGPGDVSAVIDVNVISQGTANNNNNNNNNSLTGVGRINKSNGNGMSIYISAAGYNGQMKGRGRMQVLKSVTYPITITSGGVAFATTNSGGNNGNNGGTSSTSRTTTLNGFLKPRVGAPIPFVLVATNTGTVTMTMTITTTTVNGTTVTTTTATNVINAAGKVKTVF